MYRIELSYGHSSGGAELDNERIQFAKASLLKNFAEVFGGASAVEVTGSYKLETGRVVLEQSTIIICTLDRPLTGIECHRLTIWARATAEYLMQESVGLAIYECNGTFEYVAPKR